MYEAGWAAGGIGSLSGHSATATATRRNDTAPSSPASKIREIVRDPEVAELLSPSHYTSGRKPHVRRHRLLRDLQPRQRHLVDVRPTPIEGITPRGIRDGRRRVRARHDRLRDRLRRDDRRAARHRHPRRGRPLAAREVGAPGRGRISVSTVAGFPNLFIDHRARQPVACCQQHGGLDRAARRLDRRLHRAPAGRGPRPHRGRPREAEDAWVAHVNEIADATLYPRAELVVHGREHPGQAARLHAVRRRRAARYRAECDTVAAAGYGGSRSRRCRWRRTRRSRRCSARGRQALARGRGAGGQLGSSPSVTVTSSGAAVRVERMLRGTRLTGCLRARASATALAFGVCLAVDREDLVAGFDCRRAAARATLLDRGDHAHPADRCSPPARLTPRRRGGSCTTRPFFARSGRAMSVTMLGWRSRSRMRRAPLRCPADRGRRASGCRRPPREVDQGAAAVAGVDGRAGLDGARERRAAGLRDGPAECADDALRHAALQAERVPHREHDVADTQLGRVGEGRRLEP